MSETYTVKEVAEILGYSTNSIYTFLKEKRIKGVRVGRGRFRISREEVERLLSLSKNKRDLEQIVTTPTVGPHPLSSEIPQEGIIESRHLVCLNPGMGCINALEFYKKCVYDKIHHNSLADLCCYSFC